MTNSKVAIITGASSGMGLALTKHLLAQSWAVVMVDVNGTVGADLASSLGSGARFVKADVSVWDELAGAFEFAFTEFGRIDFVAANAGIDDKSSLYEEGPDEVDCPQQPNLKTIEVDLNAVLYIIKLANYYMKRNPAPGGSVVITSSSAGLYPMETNPQYCAAKHALVGLTRAVGQHMASTNNIRVNCICPAFVPTGLAPKVILEVFPKEHITPMSTIIKAFDVFLTETHRTGEVVECTQGNLFYRKAPEYASESQRWLGEDSKALWNEAYNVKA